ncbi:MAG: FAD-dependent oxidoreductase [Planctomycetota bacterium]|jgi:NADPH-dependent glutamate synthase beta subunit-like oxidoreductase
MPKLFIDNREVEVNKGATILDAAGKLGIEIPTMCFLKDYKPSTSCMVCVVRVEGMPSLVPACGTVAAEDIRVESSSEQVYQARKAALELLLSDHLGDCLGPCQVICPADMNIPLMIRQIAAGKLREAIETVKKDIALPAVLGRICPKPCERGCRRGAYDQPVSICLLKRYVADVDLQSTNPYMPSCKSTRDKRVAIVGAGPAGLAAAYYLQQAGYSCTVFDEYEKPGGMLQYGVPEQELPRDVLDKEIALIEKLNVEFRNSVRIGTDLSMDDLCKDFDAVFVAIGQVKPEDVKLLGLEEGGKGIKIDGKTYQTNIPGVFAGGDAVHKRKLTVRAVADGKEAAVSIGQYLSGDSVSGAVKEFNTRIGKLQNGEIEQFLISCDKAGRLEPTGEDGAFTDNEASKEAMRCLHCDCRKADVCKLKQYARGHEAKATRYKSQRRKFAQELQHAEIIYEAGKCIDCGLCVQTAAKAGEELGLTFVGRGFDVRVAVPFDRSMAEALKHSAQQCVNACPTGALAFKV